MRFHNVCSIGYITANIFWLLALRGGAGLARGALIFSVSSAVIAVVLGAVLYEEQINNIQAFGIVIGIISLIFIFWNGA